MKARVFVFSVIASMAVYASTNDYQQMVQAFVRMSGRSSYGAIDKLSVEDRAGVFSEMRKLANCPDYSYYLDAELTLLHYHDPLTVTNAVRKFRNPVTQDDTADMISRCGGMEFVPFLAEDMFLNEEITKRDYRHYSSRSAEAMYVVGTILYRMKDRFGLEFRHWLSELPYWGDDLGRVMFRQWWTENKERFLKGDYAAVRPPSTWKPRFPMLQILGTTNANPPIVSTPEPKR